MKSFLSQALFYVMDRAYVDFARLFRFFLAGAFFVTRAKSWPANQSAGISPGG